MCVIATAAVFDSVRSPPTVAAPLVSSVVDATLPSTVNVPDVNTIRFVSPLMPMLASANCTDSTATYPPLDIDRDVDPLCVIATAAVFDSVRSPPTVAAPLVSSVVDATLPSTVNIPDVNTIRFVSPLMPMLSPETAPTPPPQTRQCSISTEMSSRCA